MSKTTEYAHTAEAIATRDLSWGDSNARELMQQLAAEMAVRANFVVCAIAVVRPEGWLEFVAIAGADDYREELLGTSASLEHLMWAVAEGESIDNFSFVRIEEFSERTRAALAPEGIVLDLPLPGDGTGWHPWDMFFARICDERGEQRAFVYFDRPVDGLRPSVEHIKMMVAQLAVPMRSVLTIAEREEFVHYVRVIGAVRRLVRSASSRHDVTQLIREAQKALQSVLYAVELDVHLFQGEDPPHLLGMSLPSEVADALVSAAHRAWTKQHVLLIESDRVWGDDALNEQAGDVLIRQLARHGLGAVVITPIGVDGTPLGMLVLARALGARRWTDGESDAAIELGHDLGRAIANANATRREHELLDELRRLEDERRDFLNVVVHELNNPVTVISANAEIALEHDGLPADVGHRVAAIIRGTDRIQALVNDLNQLAKSSTCSSTNSAETLTMVDVAQVVTQSVESLQAVAERGGIEIDCRADGGPLLVRGLRRAIAGAVDNVLHNAVKYSNRGGTVTVRLNRGLGLQVVLVVTDEGIGISTADQQRLFTPMFRSTNPEALQRPGTGLGLTIVKEVAEQHGGFVEIESSLDVGTTVRLALGGPDEGV